MISLKGLSQENQINSSILPSEYQEQIKKSGMIKIPEPKNLLQKIQGAITEFFGTDKNTKIQNRWKGLSEAGLDDNTATEIAIKSTQGFLKQEDLNKLNEQQKKSLGKISAKEIEDIVFGFVGGGGKEKISKVVKEKVIKETDTPISKLINILKKAKPLRAEQEAIYTAERGARLEKAIKAEEGIGGQAGFFAKKAQLVGEIQKVKFEPIKDFAQKDLDNLFDDISKSQKITEWEKLPAGTGLQKIIQGSVPTENEIALLNRVFPKEFTDEVLKKRGLLERGYLTEAVNLPRSIMSSTDLSFGGRQGAFLGVRYRKEFMDSWLKQFQTFGSEKAYKALQESVRTNKYFELAQKSGLSFTDIASGFNEMEEQFMSHWAEKLPLVKQSSRAYIGFANKFRMDVFAKLVDNAKKVGYDIADQKMLNDIAKFVNTGTGRGSLGKLERIAPLLNGVFFSPRLMASRLQILNPMFYVKLHPYVRKEALKTLITFGSTWATILGIVSMSGGEVGTDPRSSDFGKIKVGNTRIDLGAGFQQYLRAAGQLITGKYVSSTTGKEYILGEGYKPMTRLDIAGRLFESKTAPVASFALDLLRGQNYMGEPINIPQEIKDRFIPMVVSDTIELAKDNPDLLPLEVLGFFGMGVQTYEQKKKVKNIAPTGKIPSLKGLSK